MKREVKQAGWIKILEKMKVEQAGWTMSLEKIRDRMSENNSELKSLVETLENKYFQNYKGPRPPNMAMVIKPAKVPTWTKDTSWRHLEDRELDDKQY